MVIEENFVATIKKILTSNMGKRVSCLVNHVEVYSLYDVKSKVFVVTHMKVFSNGGLLCVLGVSSDSLYSNCQYRTIDLKWP